MGKYFSVLLSNCHALSAKTTSVNAVPLLLLLRSPAPSWQRRARILSRLACGNSLDPRSKRWHRRSYRARWDLSAS
jgi:hypothetical protein